jgi:PPK2 family polyphosphate:nucleotide phosphotransferase
MSKIAENAHLVPFDGSFRVADVPTAPSKRAPGKRECKERLEALVAELDALQQVLYAHNQFALLLIFQALDAAGKDGTIRAVMSGVNPAGCQVFSFKQPTPEELDHDFLWRTAIRLPERGRIGVFNRSYYEEVLVVRVHPGFLEGQNLPDLPDLATLWEERFQSIREHEQHLARSGTVVLKFWLNISREEQRERFLARIEEHEKNWKFSSGDVGERQYWDDYMQAFEEALNATSRPWAPWYAVPADSKPYARMVVAQTIVDTLKALNLKYPSLDPAEQVRLDEMREKLEKRLV